MSRRSRKGYYVRGHFVAAGSEEDLQFKAELKGVDLSKSDLKRESEALQSLGADLLTLRADLFRKLELPDKLADALQEAARITNFEGKRRQMQYIGKLMRNLDEADIAAIRQALHVQREGSAEEKQALHAAEQWRERLLAGDDAMMEWMQTYPGSDAQRLRTLVRQARKDDKPTAASVSEGRAQRKGKAYREIFQLVQQAMRGGDLAEAETAKANGHVDGDDPDGHAPHNASPRQA